MLLSILQHQAQPETPLLDRTLYACNSRSPHLSQGVHCNMLIKQAAVVWCTNLQPKQVKNVREMLVKLTKFGTDY